MPPAHNAEFVCAMENVLETYKRPYDPRKPVVAEVQTPHAARPGRPR